MASAVTLLWMVVFGIGIYLTRYTEESAVADSLYSLPSIVSIPLRSVKLLEGILYVFAPIPMFAVANWAPFVALAAYAALWTVVLRSSATSGATVLRANAWIPAMAVAMSVPFLFASDVRITGAAAVMTFLCIAGVVRCDGLRAKAIVAILALNVTGIVLNYGAFRSMQDSRCTWSVSAWATRRCQCRWRSTRTCCRICRWMRPRSSVRCSTDSELRKDL